MCRDDFLESVWSVAASDQLPGAATTPTKYFLEPVQSVAYTDRIVWPSELLVADQDTFGSAVYLLCGFVIKNSTRLSRRVRGWVGV